MEFSFFSINRLWRSGIVAHWDLITAFHTGARVLRCFPVWRRI